MPKRLYICLLITLTATIGSAMSQDLSISRPIGRSSIGFDLNSIYNYNHYEANRWGGSVFFSTPLKYDERFGTDFQNRFFTSAYVAYGTGDKGWKFGGDMALHFPRSRARSLYVGYKHDLEGIGLHNFSSYQLLNTVENSSYLSSRFSAIDRITAGIKLALPKGCMLLTEYRHSRERLLFNATELLYPNINAEHNPPSTDYDELHIRFSHNYNQNHILRSSLVDITAGNASPRVDGIARNAFMRIIAEYNHTFFFGEKGNNLLLFAQSGTTLSDHTPLSRRFLIGGTGGSHFYFSNAFLTVRPNTFMTDSYATLSLRFSLGTPLWVLPISKPKPFVQSSALWGVLHTPDGVAGEATYGLVSGRHVGSDEPMPANEETITLSAPGLGLGEVAAGIEGIIRWGYIDIGGAVAYQLTPKNATYHSNNISNTLSVMIIAKVIIDN